MDQILNSFNKPKINNLLANSVITNRPLIVVEGKDDIQFYDNISEIIDKKMIVRAVETIEGYTEGSDHVIDLTKDIQENLNEQIELKQLYLGIIDKDIRDHRLNDERCLPIISNYSNLFILNFYSFESHFINKSVIKYVLKELTSVNNNLLTEELINNIYQDAIENIIEDLYYPSLEALKNAIDPNYGGIVGYSSDFQLIINNTQIKTNLQLKIQQLDEFAIQSNISKTFDDLMRIGKGKWLLKSFTKFIKNEVMNLTSKCQELQISQCQYCEILENEKCLYKIKFPIQNYDLYKHILMNVKHASIEYIILKLNQLN